MKRRRSRSRNRRRKNDEKKDDNGKSEEMGVGNRKAKVGEAGKWRKSGRQKK